MPEDEPPSTTTTNVGSGQPGKGSQKPASIFTIPPSVKRVFDKFPLVTCPSNDLPVRAPSLERRREHTLHVYTTQEAAGVGRPSFNPSCLKWQAYLRFAGVAFRTVPSSNHASPSGALPFLLPAVLTPDTTATQDPIASSKLKKWIAAQNTAEKVREPNDLRYEAYTSLINTSIRKAWLYQLYLSPSNASLLHELYVAPCSMNIFVQMTIAYQLRHAAEAELVKASASQYLIEEDVMRETGEALDALSSLLGESQWFFGEEKPGLYDASIFAYTHLLLDEKLSWQKNPLAEMVKGYDNLVMHQERILQMYF